MKPRPSLSIIITFAILIVLGFGLLYFWGFPDDFAKNKLLASLFTATSAVCVTGLSTIDASTELTFSGQIILLVLIQLGGIGVLTLSNFFLLSITGKLDLAQRESMADTFGSMARLPINKLLKYLILFTILVEAFGACILYTRFIDLYSPDEALWLAVFHSISAFCNAGFSLFPDSLVGFRHDGLINTIIMALIIAGGLGFLVMADFAEVLRGKLKRKRLKLSLQSKIVLCTSAILIAAGFIIFLLFEWNNTLATDSFFDKLLESLFLSVSSRTAGFNSVDTGQLSTMSLTILILLMIIGASSGSTGGGIKTNTIAVFWALITSFLKNRKQAELFHRSIASRTVAKALMIILFYFIAFIIALMLLQIIELNGLPNGEGKSRFLDYMFEVISALSTVGLSNGVTGKLSGLGQIIIILCMYIGRVGPLALALSLIGERKRYTYSYPEENIMIG